MKKYLFKIGVNVAFLGLNKNRNSEFILLNRLDKDCFNTFFVLFENLSKLDNPIKRSNHENYRVNRFPFSMWMFAGSN